MEIAVGAHENTSNAQLGANSALERLESQCRLLSFHLASSDQKSERAEVQRIFKEIKGALTHGDEDGRLDQLRTRLMRLSEIEQRATNPLNASESAPIESQQHIFSKVVVFRVPKERAVKVFDNIETASGLDGSLSGLELPPSSSTKTFYNISYTLTQRPSNDPQFTEYVIGLKTNAGGQAIKHGTLQVQVDGMSQDFSYRGMSHEKLLQVTAEELEQEAAPATPAPQPRAEQLVLPPAERTAPVPQGSGLRDAPEPAPDALPMAVDESKLAAQRKVAQMRRFLVETHGQPERVKFADGSYCDCWRVNFPGTGTDGKGTIIRLLSTATEEGADAEFKWATAPKDTLEKAELTSADIETLPWSRLDTLYLQDRELAQRWRSQTRFDQLQQNACATYQNLFAQRLLQIEAEGGDPELTESLVQAQKRADSFLNGEGKSLGERRNVEELSAYLACDAALAACDSNDAAVVARTLVGEHSVEWAIGDPSRQDDSRLMTIRMARSDPWEPAPRLYFGVGQQQALELIESFDSQGQDRELSRRIEILRNLQKELGEVWGMKGPS